MNSKKIILAIALVFLKTAYTGDFTLALSGQEPYSVQKENEIIQCLFCEETTQCTSQGHQVAVKCPLCKCSMHGNCLIKKGFKDAGKVFGEQQVLRPCCLKNSGSHCVIYANGWDIFMMWLEQKCFEKPKSGKSTFI